MDFKVCGICSFNIKIESEFCGNCGNIFGKQLDTITGNFIIKSDHPKKCLKCNTEDAVKEKNLCKTCYINLSCKGCNINLKNIGHNFCQQCYVNYKFTFKNSDNNVVCPKCNVKTVTKGHELCKECYIITTNISNQKMFNNHIDSGCNHKTCKMFKFLRCHNSCFVLPLVKHNWDSICCWLGLENGGQYKGQCNLIGGKGEEIDKVDGNVCWLNIIARESSEEVKHNFNINDDDPHFVYNGNPIFIVRLDDSVSRFQCQQRINDANKNKHLPYHLKEMKYLACVDIYELKHVDTGINYPISNFATGVINEVTKLNLKIFNL